MRPGRPRLDGVWSGVNAKVAGSMPIAMQAADTILKKLRLSRDIPIRILWAQISRTDIVRSSLQCSASFCHWQTEVYSPPFPWTRIFLLCRKLIFDRDQATLDGGGGCFGAIRNLQLFDDAVDVVLDRILADVEGVADLLVGQPF